MIGVLSARCLGIGCAHSSTLAFPSYIPSAGGGGELGSWQVSLSPLGALAHCLLASGCADARMATVLPVPGEGPQASGAYIPQTWRLLSCHCCTSSALPFHPASSEALMPVGSFNLFPHFSLIYLYSGLSLSPF